MVLGRGAFLQKMADKASKNNDQQPQQPAQSQFSSAETNQSSFQSSAAPYSTNTTTTTDDEFKQQRPGALGRGRNVSMQQPPQQSQHQVQFQPTPAAAKQLQQTNITPCQPKKAKHDKSIFVNANFLKISSTNPSGQIIMYSVKFFPEVQSRGVRFAKLKKISPHLRSPYLFNGSCLFSYADLGQKFEYDGVIIEKTKSITNAEAQSVNALALKEIFTNLGLIRLGKSYFDLSTPVNFEKYNLQVYSGYTVLVNHLEAGSHVSLDTTHKVIRTESVYRKLRSIFERRMSPDQVNQIVADEIIGSVVITRYNNKTYTVVDIDWNLNPNSTFQMSDGSQISFAAYYQSNYSSAKITDFDQPMLVVQVKSDKVYLVPELCFLTGLTDSMRRDFTLMKDLAEKLKADPLTRKNDYQAFSSLVMRSEKAKQILTQWHLALEPTMVSCPAEQITNLSVYFKNGRPMPVRNADFGNSIAREAPTEPINLHSWAIVFNKKNTNNVNTFMNFLNKHKSTFNMNVSDPIRVEVGDRIENKREAIKNLVASNPNIQIVITVLETSRDDYYNVIKKLSYCELAVPSQVVIAKTLADKPKTNSVVAKILLQINCKVGGTLWTTFKMENQNDMMVVGMDVFHQRGQPSVVGVVASIDARFTKWYSKSLTHREGEEITAHFEQLFAEVLVNFHANNNRYPSKVIIYRDGVGDGRINKVIDVEYEQIKRAFKQIDPSYEPKITMIVVHKRINTRIFYNLPGSGGSSVFTNAQPGTVVDSVIIKPQYTNFYLVSQSTRQGTVTPTHYVVAIDNSGIPINELQKITYQLCYMYYNWPGAIRTPAPCQYAHKLAYMVGENLRKAPHQNLKNTLFYI